jgi:hypothetical protein
VANAPCAAYIRNPTIKRCSAGNARTEHKEKKLHKQYTSFKFFCKGMCPVKTKTCDFVLDIQRYPEWYERVHGKQFSDGGKDAQRVASHIVRIASNAYWQGIHGQKFDMVIPSKLVQDPDDGFTLDRERATELFEETLGEAPSSLLLDIYTELIEIAGFSYALGRRGEAFNVSDLPIKAVDTYLEVGDSVGE